MIERPGVLRRDPRLIIVTVSDVLPRIPLELLKSGTHDGGRELHFRLDELNTDFSRGRVAVALSKIVERVPELFRQPFVGELMIRLPLHKIIEQLSRQSADSARPEPALAVAGEAPETVAAPVATGEVLISLSLAAILRTCPAEILKAGKPPVSDTDKVTFPFAPIERQLPHGKVDVSSARFIAALPPDLAAHFQARNDIRVPLPLDEIFLNLPARTPATKPMSAPRSPTAPAPIKTPTAPTALDSPRAWLEAEKARKRGVMLAKDSIFQGIDVFKRVSRATSAAPSAPSEPAAEVVPPSTSSDPSEPIAKQAPAPAPSPDSSVVSETPIPEAVHEATEIIAPPEAEPAAEMAAPPEADVVAPEIHPEVPEEPGSEESGEPAAVDELDEETAEPSPPGSTDSPAKPTDHIEPVIGVPGEAAVMDETLPDTESDESDSEPTGSTPDPTGAPLTENAADSTPGEEAPPSSLRWVLTDAPLRLSPEVAEQSVEFLLADEPRPTSQFPVVLLAPPPVFDAPEASTQITDPQIESVPTAEPEPPRALELQAAANLLELTGDHSLATVAAHLVGLAGLQGCALSVRHESAVAGRWPDGFDASVMNELFPALSQALAGREKRLGAGPIQHLTLFADDGCVTIFSKGSAHVAVFHRPRVFMPGVREKLSAVLELPGRGVARSQIRVGSCARNRLSSAAQQLSTETEDHPGPEQRRAAWLRNRIKDDIIAVAASIRD